MTRRAVYPHGLRTEDIPLPLSPAILSNGHLFCTGLTGAMADGRMPESPETQFENTFAKLGDVLSAAGAGFADIVEMTSYHIDIADHFDTFEQIYKRHATRRLPPGQPSKLRACAAPVLSWRFA